MSIIYTGLYSCISIKCLFPSSMLPEALGALQEMPPSSCAGSLYAVDALIFLKLFHEMVWRLFWGRSSLLYPQGPVAPYRAPTDTCHARAMLIIMSDCQFLYHKYCGGNIYPSWQINFFPLVSLIWTLNAVTANASGQLGCYDTSLAMKMTPLIHTVAEHWHSNSIITNINSQCTELSS